MRMAEKVNFELQLETQKGEFYCCRGVTDFTALLKRQMSSQQNFTRNNWIFITDKAQRDNDNIPFH